MRKTYWRTQEFQSILLLSFLFCSGCGVQHASVTSGLEHDMAHAKVSAEAHFVDELALTSGASTENARPLDRKIIYNSEIELQVKDFAEFENLITPLLQKHRAFASQRNTDRRHDDHRSGQWVVRVPVQNYDAFLAGVSSLGFATSRIETAEDVTEDYVDLEARIRNKRKLEERIILMLEERAGKLSDAMEIERELSRVREEIERMEGRLRVLADQTSLATVTIRVTEKARYEPPTAPTVGDRLAGAWGSSVGAIARMATNFAIALVALVPWMLIALPITAIAYRLRHRIGGWFQNGVGSPVNSVEN